MGIKFDICFALVMLILTMVPVKEVCGKGNLKNNHKNKNSLAAFFKAFGIFPVLADLAS